MYKISVSDAFTPESLSKKLAALPEWRRLKALRYRRPIDQYLCAEAYLLLQQGVAEVFGIDCPAGEFAYGPYGKPFFENLSGVHFNISHCEKCVCCVVADEPVGIDVEAVCLHPELTEQVCSAAELEAIRLSGNPAEEFTKVWTRKEAYLKLRGEGIRTNMREVCPPEAEVEFCTTVNAERGYVLTLARRR